MIERRWADWTVADPRKAPGLPLFLVQTEAPRAEKNFLETGQPAYLKVWIGKRWWGRGGGGLWIMALRRNQLLFYDKHRQGCDHFPKQTTLSGQFVSIRADDLSVIRVGSLISWWRRYMSASLLFDEHHCHTWWRPWRSCLLIGKIQN